MSARYEFCRLSEYERVIVMSDIHGMLAPLRSVLDGLGFSEKDALVIVGDILEKGGECLETLRFVHDLYGRGNVRMVLGNNDTPFADWRDGVFTDSDICRYMNGVTYGSTLLDMAAELKMTYSTVSEVAALREAIMREYSELISFLDSLPYIIETDFAVFVHAGIGEGSLTEQDAHYCCYAPEFGRTELSFPKPVIVGHWPVSNYCESVISVNPYFNRAANVISIDGGLGLKSWQQLNYLIFSGSGELLSVGHHDTQRAVRCLTAQSEEQEPFTLIFPHTRVEILEERGEKMLVRIPYIDREMEMSEKSIYTYKGEPYCQDFTTYTLPVEAGETVLYCEAADGGILVKRDGVVGLYRGRWEWEE